MNQEIKAGLLSLLGLVQQHIVAALKDLPANDHRDRARAWKALQHLKSVEVSLMECIAGSRE